LASFSFRCAVFAARNFVAAGGLISYGPEVISQSVHAADYVDRILKGTAGLRIGMTPEYGTQEQINGRKKQSNCPPAIIVLSEAARPPRRLLYRQ
jgi:hypothetical protein